MSEIERLWHQNYPPEVPYSVEYPKVPLPQLLIQTASDFPNKISIRFLGKDLTFQELLKDVYRFAHALKRIGVEKGERIGIMLPNSPQAVIAYYASLMVGAVVVQVNPLYTERELRHQLTDSGMKTIICLDLVYNKVKRLQSETQLDTIVVTSMKDYLPPLKKILYPIKAKIDGMYVKLSSKGEFYPFMELIQSSDDTPIQPVYHSSDDLALLQYTGGTTGLAKGAMLSHGNLIANMRQARAWFYKTERGQGSIMAVIPFVHVYGMTTVMNFAIAEGLTMVIVPRFEKDLSLILKLIDKYKPSFFPGAPTTYIGLINHPKIHQYDLSSIEACVSGSSSLPHEVQEKFEEITKGFLVEGYGLTEASPVTHSNLIWDRKKVGTIGLPWPDTDARIVNPETGEPVDVNEQGELLVKGPQIMLGYWNNPKETDQVLQDGWLKTGDIARMDEDGYFYIVDRKKDVIIASGFNIYPREVEEVLFEHPAIQEVVVIGAPDPYRGETVKAVVVFKEGESASEEELDRFARERLVKYKVPRIYEFRSELPKSSVGKVLRRTLKEEARQLYEQQVAESKLGS
ncbi:AMP-binding protein [Hazenella sp. IB182357]|uniref:AMP-binding protein n=1 Tax=Polycladospora coralii TaxID=2771432 RepID=A0A926RTE3_9BACL|nr:AMP-binding protein [Polycladospora coralii]MBD1371054.1 AMP-binding protein [Polycladospora coralii]